MTSVERASGIGPAAEAPEYAFQDRVKGCKLHPRELDSVCNLLGQGSTRAPVMTLGVGPASYSGSCALEVFEAADHPAVVDSFSIRRYDVTPHLMTAEVWIGAGYARVDVRGSDELLVRGLRAALVAKLEATRMPQRQLRAVLALCLLSYAMGIGVGNAPLIVYLLTGRGSAIVALSALAGSLSIALVPSAMLQRYWMRARRAEVLFMERTRTARLGAAQIVLGTLTLVATVTGVVVALLKGGT